MNQTRSLLAVSLAVFLLAGCGVSTSPVTTGPSTGANVYIAAGGIPAQIEAIPANSTGSPTSADTITLPGLNTVTAIALDSAGNIYAATATDIREYAAGALGAATPIRTIPFDSTTTLTDSFSIAVDSAGNIYAAQLGSSGNQNSGSILVFSGSANGSVAPIRTISGALTGLGSPMQIALDGSGNLYVLALNVTLLQSSILVFAPAATGNVAPARTLNEAVLAIAVDHAGDLYTVSYSGIAIYAPGASGRRTPVQVVSSASLGYPAFTEQLPWTRPEISTTPPMGVLCFPILPPWPSTALPLRSRAAPLR